MRARISAILLLTIVLSLLSETALAASTRSFAVVDPSVNPALEYAANRGLLMPQADGLLHPERSLTRIDLIRAVVQDVYALESRDDCFDNIAPSLPARYTLLFTDVPRTRPYAPDVCVGMFVGVVSGRPDGSLRPLESANLVETAKIVTKAYGIAPFPGLRPNPRVPWHEPYWFALARRGAIPETVVARNAVLTRGEFAEILYRLRDERPSVGVRGTPTFALQGRRISHIDDAATVAGGTTVNDDGWTLQQRDRYARAVRMARLVAPAPVPSYVPVQAYLLPNVAVASSPLALGLGVDGGTNNSQNSAVSP